MMMAVRLPHVSIGTRGGLDELTSPQSHAIATLRRIEDRMHSASQGGDVTGRYDQARVAVGDDRWHRIEGVSIAGSPAAAAARGRGCRR
jgi:hypothetical protein